MEVAFVLLTRFLACEFATSLKLLPCVNLLPSLVLKHWSLVIYSLLVSRFGKRQKVVTHGALEQIYSVAPDGQGLPAVSPKHSGMRIQCLQGHMQRLTTSSGGDVLGNASDQFHHPEGLV